MGKILSFLVAIGKRKQAEESEQLSTQRIEYVRQLVGCELYNRAHGMPVRDVLAALDQIRADVERHALTGGRIV